MKLKTVEKVINENFPNSLGDVKACLSVFAQMRIEDINQPMGLVLVGVPASQKGTVLSMFRDVEEKVWVDDFTSRSFVSHYMTKEKKLKEIDLLPKIRDKIMITPELAPLFNARKEDLMKNFGVITRVFDGQGYQSASGIHGLRGYLGSYMFGFIGATVPVPPKVWRVLGHLGSRWLFLNVEKEADAEEKDLIEDYKLKLDDCKEVITPFVDSLMRKNKVKWDKKNDNYLKEVITLSKVSCKMRGNVSTWKDYWKGEDDGGSYIESNIPIIEKSYRVASLMYGIARGHALIHGRSKINKEDMTLLDDIFMSSMPEERRRALLVAKKCGYVFTSDDLERELKVSQPTAFRIMETFKKLGFEEEDFKKAGVGRPEKAIKFDDLGDLA